MRAVIKVSSSEARARLSELLARVADGERVVICKHNQPVAELRHFSEARTEPRKLGLARGEVHIPDSFFDPLPDEILRSFGS